MKKMCDESMSPAMWLGLGLESKSELAPPCDLMIEDDISFQYSWMSMYCHLSVHDEPRGMDHRRGSILKRNGVEEVGGEGSLQCLSECRAVQNQPSNDFANKFSANLARRPESGPAEPLGKASSYRKME